MPESYVPLDGRRQAVVIVFAFIAVVSLVAVVSDVLEIGLMDRLAAGEIVSEADATASDHRQSLVGVVQLAALIAGAITFIRWLHGAYRNVDVVEPSERRYGPGWAIGCWFVPILSVWRPKQIVNDVWRAGSPDRSAKPGWLLLVWWLAFVISNLVANGAIRATFDGDTPERLRDAATASAVSDAIDIAGAVLAILVVRAATDRLDGRAAAKAPAPGTPGGGWQAPERPAGLPA